MLRSLQKLLIYRKTPESLVTENMSILFPKIQDEGPCSQRWKAPHPHFFIQGRRHIYTRTSASQMTSPFKGCKRCCARCSLYSFTSVQYMGTHSRSISRGGWQSHWHCRTMKPQLQVHLLDILGIRLPTTSPS